MPRNQKSRGASRKGLSSGDAELTTPSTTNLETARMPSYTQGRIATSAGPIDPHSLSCADVSDLDDIYIRQLKEDIAAYEFDMEYCSDTLAGPDLSPQEARTLRLRQLDLQHQIRHCRHRVETLTIQQIQQQQRAGVAFSPLRTRLLTATASGAGTTVAISGTKRPSAFLGPASRGITDGGSKRTKPTAIASPDSEDDSEDYSPTNGEMRLQRLGSWRCRLCTSHKYLLAGVGRLPAAPCKWALKDISKMIVHFTEMHVEHEPAERCIELGAALDHNRGPFEYWLRRTRAQNIGDGGVVNTCIQQLRAGRLPDLLRKLSRAASTFPNDGAVA